MSLCFECFLLSGRGLCDELITRPKESYRLWCVVVCDLENLVNEEVMAHRGAVAPKTKKQTYNQEPMVIIRRGCIQRALNGKKLLAADNGNG